MTIKQRKFIKRYVENRGNGTRAALEAYNVSDPNVAKVIASQNLTKPNIKRGIELALETKGLTDEYIGELLRDATVAGLGNKATNADSLRGIDMMLKLKDAYPTQKTAHLRVNYQTEYKAKLEKLSIPELKEELTKLKEKSDELLKDIGEKRE